MYVGLHDDDTTLGFHDVVRGQLDLQGSYAYTAEDYEQALEWLVEGKAGIGELPPVLPLEEGPGAFAELVRGPSEQIKVFLAERRSSGRRGPLGEDGARHRGEQRHRARHGQPLRRRGRHGPRRGPSQGGHRRGRRRA